jgi:hypothetical protein
MAQTKVKLISDGVIVQGNLHASHGITTADIGEGSNLYYTDARVGSYLSTNSFATESYVGTQIANLVDSSPSALNTLNELAAALGDDANFSTTVTNSIALKAPLASPSFTGNATFAGSITGTSASLTTSGTVLSLDRTGGATALIELKVGGTVEGYLGATTTKSLVVYNESASEKFSVSNGGDGTFAGNVLIGTNINSSIGLQVNQSLGSGNAIGFFRNSASSGGNGLVVDVTNTPNNYLADFRIGNSSKVRIDSSGNVGINASASLRFNGTGDNTHAVGYDSIIDGSFLRGQLGMRFLTGTGGGSERMRIESTGVVKFPNTATSTGDVGTIAHYTNNYMYIRGGTGGLAIGDDGFDTSIYLNNSNSIQFQTGGSEKMRINSQGQMWLGGSYTGSDIANGSTGYMNNLNAGSFSILHRNSSDAYVHFNSYYTSSNTYVSKYSGRGFMLGYNAATDTGFFFSKAPNTTAGQNQTFSQVMTVGYGTSNNVGIGTTAPVNKLGIEVAANSNTKAINIYSKNTSPNSYTSIGSQYSISNTYVESEIRFGNETQNGGGSYLGFVAGGTNSGNTEKMRITSGGNVNVGTYESGAGSITGPFVVTHTSSRFMTVSYEDSMVSINSKNNNNNLENLRLAGDNVVFYSGTNTTGSERMRITSSGRVGIGNTNPQAALDISSSYSIQGGVYTYYYTGHATGQSNINLDITVNNEGGGGNVFKIEAGFAHYFDMSYNSIGEWWCTSRGTGVVNTYILNAGSANAGTWSSSKPTTSVLRITKSAGTYVGGGKYWVKVTYRPY